MQFSVDDRVFSLYPSLQITLVVARDLDNTGQHPRIQQELANEAGVAGSIFASTAISSHPNIGVWREAYRAFGPASRHHSSIEALVVRAVKGKGIRSINPVVDLYNLVSLRYLIPIGGEDVAQIKGNVRLSIAQGGESFVPLGENHNDPPEAGEIGYFDDAGCLCRRFNWREADRTKLTLASKRAIFSLEGLAPVTDIDLKEAADALGKRLQEFCGGTAKYYLVNQRQPRIHLAL